MLEQCHFPELKEPFATALREVVVHAIEHYQPIGLIAAGSVMRGEGHATSDIDLYVIFEADYRQIEHKFFNGVPCQLFCNPPQRVLRYFDEERGRLNNGPTTAHMLASGTVILDRDPRIARIRDEARKALELPPQPNQQLLQLMRYHAVSAVENALDVHRTDPDMAMLEICNALPNMLHYYFLKQGKYVPRHKDTLKQVRQHDPDLARLVHQLFVADESSRADLLLEIADKTLEVRCFFEYIWRDEDV